MNLEQEVNNLASKIIQSIHRFNNFSKLNTFPYVANPFTKCCTQRIR